MLTAELLYFVLFVVKLTINVWFVGVILVFDLFGSLSIALTNRRFLILGTCSPLLFAIHFSLDDEVFIQELSQDLLGELTPKLRHEVSSD